jgi:cytochrome P450
MFTPRALADLRDRVVTMTRQLIRDRRGQVAFDFKNLAHWLPIMVIGDLLGLPVDEVTDFDAWSTTMLAISERGASAGTLRAAEQAARTAVDKFEAVCAQREVRPGTDVVSRLMAARPQGGRLTLEEIVAMCVLLHSAGHSTATDLFTSGIYHLLREPGAQQALRADPALVPGAVEEFLRYEPPVFVALPRRAPRPMQVGDHTIGTGELVYAIIGAANRDPQVFDEPDCFDVTRVDNQNLSFARGIHFCLGAHLARLEVQVAVELLVTEFPPLELAVEPADLEWEPSFIHRGLVSLPVTWGRP